MWRTRLICFVWLVVIGGAALVGAAPWVAVAFIHIGDEANDAPSRAQVELEGRVKLPPDVGDLHARLQEAWMDRWMVARFSIAPGELPDLLASSDFGALSIGPLPFELPAGDAPDWWTPGSARSYVTGKVAHRAILVDEDRPDRYVVYLYRYYAF